MARRAAPPYPRLVRYLMFESSPYPEIWSALEMRDYEGAEVLLEEVPGRDSREWLAARVSIDWATCRYSDVVERTEGLQVSADQFEQRMLWLRARSLLTLENQNNEGFSLLYELMRVGDFETRDLALAEIAWYQSRSESRKAAIVTLRRNESFVGERSALMWVLLLDEIGWHKEAKNCLQRLRGRFSEAGSAELEFVEALVAYDTKPEDESARRLLEAAVRAQQWSDPTYIIDAANSFLRHGRWAEAESISLLCADILPGWQEPYTNLAIIYLMQGHLLSAWKAYKSHELRAHFSRH